MRKNKAIGFIAATLLAATGIAQANPVLTQANRQFSLSIGAQYLDYVEIDDFGLTPDGILDSERGAQRAARVSVGYQGHFADVENMYFRFDIAGANGDTHYQGYLMGTDETGELVLVPHGDTTRDRMYTYSVKVGKSIPFDGDLFQLTPYISYGTRYWVRELLGEDGYRENYEHHALGGGALLQWAKGRTVFSVDLNVARIIEASLDVPEFETELSLGAKEIFTGSVGFDFGIGDCEHLLVNYEYASFDYGISGVVNDIFEPNSTTKQQRLFLGIAIDF